MKCRRDFLLAALALGFTGLLIGEVSADQPRDAGSKARGEVMSFWNRNQSFSRRTRHATEYARGVREYVQQAQTATAKPDVQPMVDEIDRNLAAAKQDLAAIKAGAPKSDEVQAAIAKIEKLLAEAEHHQHGLVACCAKPSVDANQAMECCDGVTKALEQAHAEHAALLKQLHVQPAAPVAK